VRLGSGMRDGLSIEFMVFLFPTGGGGLGCPSIPFVVAFSFLRTLNFELYLLLGIVALCD